VRSQESEGSRQWSAARHPLTRWSRCLPAVCPLAIDSHRRFVSSYNRLGWEGDVSTDVPPKSGGDIIPKGGL
jgi:hypothetical protein